MHSPRLRAAATLLLMLIAFAPRAARHQMARASLTAAFASQPESGIALPAGFSATIDLATSQRFVHVVANDIDRDGDLDIVASVGTLDLLVWQNDGAGHFSRLASSSHQELRAQPPVPTFNDGGLASNEWIQNDQPRDAVHGTLLTRAYDAGRGPLSAHLSSVTGQFGPRVRSSRAPPVDPLL